MAANSANVFSVGLITVGDPIGEGVTIGLLPIEKMPPARPTKFKSLSEFLRFLCHDQKFETGENGGNKKAHPVEWASSGERC